MIRNLDQIFATVKNKGKMKLAVASAEELEVLKAVEAAIEKGIIEVVLFGDENKIHDLIKEHILNLGDFLVVNASDLEVSSKLAIQYINEGKADFLMKGLVDTSILLKAVLDKENGLRSDSLLSHIMVYEVPTYHKLLICTDGGMNLYPDVKKKGFIIKNALKVTKALGYSMTKVACLAAKEKVNPKMQATVDAMELEKMWDEGEFGDDVIVEGPMALDLAISKEAARIKGYSSEVAGDADVLLMPNIEMGNGIGKALTYFAKAQSAGIVMGAKVPIVLTSRADSYEDKLNAIALGSLIAEKND